MLLEHFGAVQPPPLSPREQEVLALLGQGVKTGAIAAHLYLSRKTVESHIQMLRRKLALTSINQVIVYACWQAIYGTPPTEREGA